MEFNDRLKQIMRSRGMTQTDLAATTGCSEMAISVYVRGKNMPGYFALKSIAESMNVSADYLLGLTDVPRRANYNEGVCDTAER